MKKVKTNIILSLFFLLTTFIIFVGLEIFASILVKPSRLNIITNQLEIHENRFWSGKPNHDAVFFNERTVHNQDGLRHKTKDYSDVDLIVLGASPSYGWGVKENEMYSEIISSNISDINVLNAATIGYSSFQGKLLLEELLKKSNPKFITISYVINDVDHYRFVRNFHSSDKDVPTLGIFEKFMFKASQNLNLFKYLLNLFSNKERFTVPGPIRVTKKDYYDNYSQMIQLAKSKSITPILIKFPVELHLQKLPSEFTSYIDNSVCKDKKDPLDLFSCLDKNNLIKEEFQFTNNLRKLMAIYSSNLVKEYHQILEKLAKENNIPLIDIAHEFSKSSDYLFLDKKIDPIHPNILGHKLIGELIAKKLKSLRNNSNLDNINN